jgi:hypothetical protein
MMRQGFDLEMEGRHVGVEADEVVRVGASFGAMLGRAVEETSDCAHGLQECRHAEVIE